MVESANKGAVFDNTVTVSTPVREDYQPDDPSSLGKWYNVYSELDIVQTRLGGNDLIDTDKNEIGSAGRTFDEEKNPNVTNIEAPYSKLSALLSRGGTSVSYGTQEHIGMQNGKGVKALEEHVKKDDDTFSTD